MQRLRNRVAHLLNQTNASTSSGSGSSTGGGGTTRRSRGHTAAGPHSATHGRQATDHGQILPRMDAKAYRHSRREVAREQGPLFCCPPSRRRVLSLLGMGSLFLCIIFCFFRLLCCLKWLTLRRSSFQVSVRPWPEKVATECWTEYLVEPLAPLCEQSPALGAQRLPSSACGWGEYCAACHGPLLGAGNLGKAVHVARTPVSEGWVRPSALATQCGSCSRCGRALQARQARAGAS